MRWALALGLVAAFAGSARAGGTFEIGFGGGVEITHETNHSSETMVAGSSPTIAAGGRLNDRTWLVGRISLAFAKDTSFAFFGGSLQYFPTDRFFVAGGVGMVEQDFDEPIAETNITGIAGFALDLRAGVNLFPEYRHTVLLQLELTPTFYKHNQSVGVLLLASYQYL
jgi:hypothetical protein